jgi:hypothetical protein
VSGIVVALTEIATASTGTASNILTSVNSIRGQVDSRFGIIAFNGIVGAKTTRGFEFMPYTISLHIGRRNTLACLSNRPANQVC